jgi:3-carboxy-cis,cis-muconate cycloisomerase
LSTADLFDIGLLSPGTVGHESSVGDTAVVAAMVRVETALTAAWEAVGTAPAGTSELVRDALRGPFEARELADGARQGGNPVIPLVPLMRARVAARDAAAAEWVHRGATSQDILDTALMLVAADTVDALVASTARTARAAADLAEAHRATLQVGRTLTQHSTPITFGVVAAGWAMGAVDAHRDLARVRAALPVQLGGASGTLASFVEVGGEAAAAGLAPAMAAELGLAPSAPWQVRRAPVTRLADAVLASVDVAGAVASEVALLSRPEIGELAEGSGGGSSSMPQKQNPVRSVLLRSLAQRAPGLAAELHRSAATTVDQRPDGAWHAEWPALRELLRLALGAGALLPELLGSLRVDADRMTRNLADAGPGIMSERVSLAEGQEAAAALLRDPEAHAGDRLLDPAGYLGLSDRLVDEARTAVDGMDRA